MTERELRALGEMIFDGLKSGSIAIQNATDQAAVKDKSYRTIEDLVGIVLAGRLPHAFEVVVVEAWLGSSEAWERSEEAASVTIEAYRALFFSELLRLVPHKNGDRVSQTLARRWESRAARIAGLHTSVWR